VILIPESWLKHNFGRPLSFLAAVLAALSAYLAVQHGCMLAQTLQGGTNYTPLALSIIAYAIAAIVVISSSRYSRSVRLLIAVTLPLAVFFVPSLAVGVLQDIGSRACALQR
jgi:hypothetical protein